VNPIFWFAVVWIAGIAAFYWATIGLRKKPAAAFAAGRRGRPDRLHYAGESAVRFWVVALVIAVAMLESLTWVFLVPLFQAPDEPDHTDYVFWIAHQHRLPSAADVESGIELSDPQVLYLVETLQTFRVAFHLEEKAPAGYGTPAYWQQVDAAAPPVPRPGGRAGRPRLSYLYPFGYYLVAGLWVYASQLVFPSSLSSVFFSLRILSVLMLGGTLTLAFGIFRLLRIPFRRAVALLAIVGLFPLTTFVSSYCQPDNLALLLSTAALYLGLRLMREDDVRLVVLLGCVLGYLCVTKVQFFIPVGFAVGAAYFTRFHSWHLWSRAALVRLALLTVPAVATSLISRPIVAGAPKDASFGTAPFSAAASQGFGSFAAYAAGAIEAAFENFFGLGGASFTSYWGTFGWMDTPLTIGGTPLEDGILDVLEFCTAAVMTAVLLVVAALTVRAFRAALRGHPALALRAYFSNPALTAYFTFAAVIFALFVYTDGGFFPQGRNWLPLIVPIVLVTVIVSPKLFARSALQSLAASALTALLLAYSLVGSIFALKSVDARYYDRSYVHALLRSGTKNVADVHGQLSPAQAEPRRERKHGPVQLRG
jgi:hypothetical protein